MAPYWRLGFLFGVAIFSINSDALVIIEPADISGRYLPTPEFACIPDTIQGVTGPVINLGTVNTMEELPAALAGKIVYIQYDLKAPMRLAGTPNEKAFFLLLQYNPIAIIYTNPLTNVPGASESLIDSPDVCANLTVPSVEMGYVDGLEFTRLLAESNGTLIARVATGDENPWRVARRGAFMKVWQTIMGFFAFICSAGALAKLIAFVRAYGPQISVAQLSLLFLFLGNLFRLVYIALDPVYSGLLLLVYQAHMFVSIHFPLAIMTTLLLSLYYQELLIASRVEIATFLMKFKIPYLILSLIVIGIEIATSVLRAARYTNIGTLTTVAGVVYAIILAILAIFFFVVGVRVLFRLKAGDKLATKSQAARRTLRNATILVICCGIFNIIWILGSLFIAIRQIFWTLIGQYLAWTFVYVGIFGLSLTQVIVLRAPKTTLGFLSGWGTLQQSGSNATTPRPNSAVEQPADSSYMVTDSMRVIPSTTAPSLLLDSDTSSSTKSGRQGDYDASSLSDDSPEESTSDSE